MYVAEIARQLITRIDVMKKIFLLALCLSFISCGNDSLRQTDIDVLLEKDFDILQAYLLQDEDNILDRDPFTQKVCPEQNRCTIKNDKRCYNETLPRVCKEDENGCLMWQDVTECKSNETCSGPGECIVEKPALSFKYENIDENRMKVEIFMYRANENLFPRIVDLKVKYSSALFPDLDSKKIGDGANGADKKLTPSLLSNNILRFAILGYSTDTIPSGKLATIEFVKKSDGLIKIEFVKSTEEIFSPPSSNKNITFGNSVCVPYCSEQSFSDGCGGECQPY